ncbi:MAG: TRAP transporter small permease [Aquamicrobium sp.]|uniref:TRAP transporter small permease n=1 Tax=Aquamicrobium sp. TaxID=1872579 RepID=UPI00349E6E7C|nr:TRAP transporter small permease [Aquamicrobium sp.]
MDRISAIVERLARLLAILGGLVLVAVTALTVASIAGRAFTRQGLGPVPGDFELVEALTAFAVFAFLPWCQLRRGHATVDVFTRLFSERANRLIDLVCEILMTAVVVLIAWRLWHGVADKLRYHETTFILQFPLWWSYAAAFVAAAAGVVVSVYAVLQRLREFLAPAEAGPEAGDAP